MVDYIRYEGLVKNCQEILTIPSESGNEKNVAYFVQNLMKELDFDETWIDEWGNVIGTINGNGSYKVLLDGHIDTVGVGNSHLWKHNPYGGVIENGRIYGRGASDMKCALVAMIHAAASLQPFKERLKGDIIVAGIANEEVFEGVSLSKVLDKTNPDIVILGEASELKLKIGQRGRAEIKITTYGKSAHSSNPSIGINAVKQMFKLLSELESLSLPSDQFLGDAILELTDIHSEPYPGKSIIPEECTATFDRRLLPYETQESVLKPIKDIIRLMKSKDPTFDAEVKIVEAKEECFTGKILSQTRFFPGWIFPQEAGFVKTAKNALKQVGLDPRISYYSFCTDGSQSAGIQNIPTIGFGPSKEELAHIVDEYIDIEQVEKAYEGYISLIRHFLSE